MKYVIVGGTVLIDQGKLVANVFPGKALTSASGRKIKIVIQDQRGEQQHQVRDGKSEGADG